MYLIIYLSLIFLFTKESSSTMCYCNERDCTEHINNGDCEADYCYVQKLLPHLPPNKYGCVTTRQDLTDFGCEQNFQGGVTCICKGDYCNTEKLATSSFVEHKTTVMCNVVSQLFDDQTVDPQNRPICRGAYCIYQEFYIVNQFMDYKSEQIQKRCSFNDVEKETVSSLSALNWIIDINEDACVIIQDKTNVRKTCKCTTDFCNDKPTFDVKIGSKTCYLFNSAGTMEMSYCKGDYCYWQRSVNGLSYFRGCLSVATANKTPLKTYKTVVGLQETYICDVDFCNGEPATNLQHFKLDLFCFSCIFISFLF